MGYLNNFPKHKVVEINKMVGLRTGDMIADIPFSKPQSGLLADSIDNGCFFELTDTGAIVLAGSGDTGTVVADDKAHRIFFHYTEELITGPIDQLDQFTVEYDDADVAYPRLVKMYVGDVITTDNFTGTLGTTAKKIGIKNGQLDVASTYTTGPAFLVKKSTMPDGKVGAEVMYLG